MNPTATYSKSGKGVQEASGKTSLLKRPDRAVLSAIDGRATLADVAQKVGRTFDAGFEQLIGQLDKDGFIREVSAGTAPAAKPAAKGPAKPSAPTGPMDAASDLDFSSLSAGKPASPPPSARAAPAAPKPAAAAPKPAPAAPKPDAAAEARAKEQQSALNKAREEAEAKAQTERDRIKAEAEAKMRAELESNARAEAEAKLKAEAESRAKGDAEAKAKVEAERKAREEAERRLEQERKAREEAERKAREEAERARKQLEEERKAREAAERKAREEAERARKQLEEERRKLEEERKREEEERAARRKREEEEEQARRKQREEEERRAEEERAARRKQREEEEERQAEEERAARRKQREEENEREPQEAAQEKPREKPKVEAKPAPKAAGGLDSLLADLDSFTQRDEDERKANEEAERKAKAEAERKAREDAERREREDAERKAKEAERAGREDEARGRKEEEKRLAREQEKEQARLREEEQSRKHEADERARKAKEEEALARKATSGAVLPVGEDTDEVRRRMVGKRGAAAGPSAIEAPSKRRRPGSWGRPVAITFILLLAAAIGIAHVMPIPTEDYERAASEALGRPVKIGSARLSLMTGLQLHFKEVKIGDGVTIASVVGSPELDALRGEKKIFSRIDLEGVKMPQQALGEALFAKVKGDNFAVGRIVVKQLELDGPVPLPKPLEADLAFGPDGKLRSATVRGPDTLLARLAPKDAAIEFEVTASGFPLPVAPEVTLSDFGMKGTASQRGMSITEWGGKLLGGTISGTANVRWGGTWNVEGLITARNINAAVFAPALLSDGKAEGSGKFSMSGAEPAKLAKAGRIEGSFTVSTGVLGSFDLARAIQTAGKQVTGRTQFAELNGQAVYDRGAVALRNVTIGAGALNAGASADIAQSGALSGRIVADMKTANQTLRATLNLGGTVKEPQVRN